MHKHGSHGILIATSVGEIFEEQAIMIMESYKAAAMEDPGKKEH